VKTRMFYARKKLAELVETASSTDGWALSNGRPLQLLQERGETFRDRLVGGIVLGSEPIARVPAAMASGQDVTTFGLVRATTTDQCGARGALTCSLSTKYPFLLRTSVEL
jgi:hypothetical protein